MEYVLDTSFYAPHRRIIITFLNEFLVVINPGCLLFIFLNIEVTYSISESLMSCRNRYAFQLLNGVMFVSSKQEQEFLKIKI